WQDLIQGLAKWKLWGRLGFLEVKRRYRRTIIGPFWSALTLGIFIATMGTVGIGLWKQSAATYLPYLTTGMLAWLMISTMLTEAGILFITGGHLFRQVRFDYSILAYALVWRNLIAFLHNLIIYIVVVVIFAPHLLKPTVLLVIPGLLFLMINGVWMALLVGMICLRFRDVQQLITSVIQISMLVTPIFWPDSMLTGTERLIFVDLNPLYHFVEIVRAPLIGRVPSLASYEMAVVVTLLGWTATYVIFRHFRKRIAFWS
ncbi:MAG TPA: ABC transporter permease, partial [Terriglobales bacterium]|nr:ABC transporter permease [Terriglobales bacterium]